MKTRTRKIRENVAAAKEAKSRMRFIQITENLLLCGCTPGEIAGYFGRDIRDVLSFMTDIDEEVLKRATVA